MESNFAAGLQAHWLGYILARRDFVEQVGLFLEELKKAAESRAALCAQSVCVFLSVVLVSSASLSLSLSFSFLSRCPFDSLCACGPVALWPCGPVALWPCGLVALCTHACMYVTVCVCVCVCVCVYTCLALLSITP